MKKRSFNYIEDDSVGIETLDTLANAPKFLEWTYEVLKPFLKGNILEIGSGNGNISEQLLKNNCFLTVSDIRKQYCDILSQRLSSFSNLKNVLLLDIADKNVAKFENFFENFDTVMGLNILEHIEEEQIYLKNCEKLLKKDGNLIVLVPAFEFLYNKFDEELHHFRRYDKKYLRNLLENHKFKVQKMFYFNFLGTFGWFLSGKLQRNKQIPTNQVKIFNFFVKIAKILDKITFQKIGLSLIAVARKN